jgi:predicted MFS family arabinose efflux permease
VNPSGPIYKRYALGMLTFTCMFNGIDRSLMTLLLQQIRGDLQLSDTQLGFVTGMATGLFYAVLGLPIARWADRGNRSTITAIAMGLWSLMLAASLIVSSFVHLVFARIGAAVGEAGCTPPAYSLIGDYYPEATERMRAVTAFMLGSHVASLISFTLGGWLAENHGWRMTLFVIGAPGLIVALLVKLTIREPRTVSGFPIEERSLPPISDVVKVLWGKPSTRHLIIAMTLLLTLGLGLAPWYAAFMIRSHGMTLGPLGVWLALIFGGGGLVGTWLGGYVANRWFANDERGQMRLSAVAIALVVPCYALFLLLPDKHHALIALAVLVTLFGIYTGPTFTLMQRLVPNRMRATTMSLVMLLGSLVGMGLGPQVVGILSDQWSAALGTDSLRYAMLTLSFVGLSAAGYFWLAGRTVREDLISVAND